MNIKLESQNPESPNIKLKNSTSHVMCPNSLCKIKLPKSELEKHINKTCPGVIINCPNQNFGCPYKSHRKDMIAHEWHCSYRQKSPESSLTSVTLSSNSSVFQTDVNGSQDVLNHNGNMFKNVDNIFSNQSSDFYTPLSYPDNEFNTEDFCITITNINRMELGLSFVGGYDTPLQCIVVQEIFRDGLIAQDSRLHPCDQLVKVNEYNLSRASHNECRDILNRICLSGDTMYFTIHRDSTDKRWPPPIKEEISVIILDKPQGKKIGLKLAGKTNKPGLYIQEVFPDTLAAQDGRLKKDDRILQINDEDFIFGTQVEALKVMQQSFQQVTFKISRFIRPQTPDIIRATSIDAESPDSTPIVTSLSYPGLKCATTFGFNNCTSPLLAHHQMTAATGDAMSTAAVSAAAAASLLQTKFIYREEVIDVEKKSGESLGMSVAGGVNSQRGDTPVYITNVAPNSILRQQKQQSTGLKSSGIGKGDILLAVNDSELLGLSHERAVEALRLARDNCNKVTVRVLKVPNISATINSENFIPTWLYWLRLPSYCQIPRTITLARDPITGSIGFSIVGGNDLVNMITNNNFNETAERLPNTSADLRMQREPLYRPIMIKSIVVGSPAHKNGRLKCGDILVSINDSLLTNVSHSEAVALFKSSQAPLSLKVVSWPGTIV